MSELINNREYRKKAIKEIILELHKGKTVEEVKGTFDELVKDVAGTEISLIEQELINEGLPVEEVQRLCDVHSAVFKESLEQQTAPETVPGHPVHTFRAENQAVEKLITEEIEPCLTRLEQAKGAEEEKAEIQQLQDQLNLVWDVDKHYSRKENLLFPYLEKYEISGPPKVMWGVHDEIRNKLKDLKKQASAYATGGKEGLLSLAKEVLDQIKEMTFKEEKILFPMALETLTESEWYHIMVDSDEIGFCLIEPETGWQPTQVEIEDEVNKIANEHTKGHVKFDTGVLTPQEISEIFNHLPVDITFVNKDGIVKYFSNGKERIFARTRTILGRKVDNCHPPASVHVVQKLVEEFQNGTKDHEDFWLQLGEKFVYIRYFAVRDEQGEFMGVVEVSQDIKPIQAISGEKRIMD